MIAKRAISSIVIGVVVMTAPICAQNLIVNPSFEEYSVPCEDIIGQGRIYDSYGWERATRNYNGASDLISPCSITGYIPPDVVHGFQQPLYGFNYAFIGFDLNWFSQSNHDFLIESIQPTLKEPLVLGKCYQIDLSISLADYSSTDWSFGLDCYFSAEEFTMEVYSPPGITPQISFSSLDTLSKTEWRRLKSSFTPSDTLKHLTIGWLSSNWVFTDHSFFESGFFIDNVALYPCDAPVYVADAGADVSVCKGDSVELSTPYRNDEYMYWWVNSFGDTISTERTIMVDDSPSTYFLAQMDFKFDVTWDTVSVFNESCLELELPNVFTPNGDGENDVWIPIGKDIEEIDLQVYSRWGKLVWSYSGRFDELEGWNGGAVPEGNYYLVAKGIGSDGKTVEEKGSITLLR
ncbi:gliding motility-associated C-terminal domain-containing protein [Cryomorphaceae bacterium]|nr:gliding motility-associated C-terminal domain-containing protein [Cryomorphaceae bacterium]